MCVVVIIGTRIFLIVRQRRETYGPEYGRNREEDRPADP